MVSEDGDVATECVVTDVAAAACLGVWLSCCGGGRLDNLGYLRLWASRSESLRSN